MTHTQHRLDITDKLLSDLLSTIEKNNEITNEQNNKLSIYTKWLVALTMVIAFLTIVMVSLMVLQYNYKQPSSIISPEQYTTTPLKPPQAKIYNNPDGARDKAKKQTKP